MRAAEAQPAKPMTPAPRQPLTKADALMKTNNVIIAARNTLQPIEMTFVKVLDTIDSILSRIKISQD